MVLNVPLSRTVRRTRHNAKHKTRQRGDVQREEEDEGVVVVVPGRGDDRGGDERADEGGCLPDDGEKREEEEPVKVADVCQCLPRGEGGVPRRLDVHLREWGDFANHGLTIRIPWADHEAVVRLVQPE